MKTTYNPEYTGKEQIIPANKITVGSTPIDESKYNIVVSGNATDVTDEGATVTVTPKTVGYTGKAVLNYKIKPLELDGTTKNKKISEHFKATLKTTDFKYTGNIIRVKATDVTLTDIDTGADLSNYLKADDKGYVNLSSQTSAKEVGETTLRLNLINGQPETGTKNYSIKKLTAPYGTSDKDGFRTVETSNKIKIAVRDLADVNISIKPMAIPANGILNDSNLLITYTDKDTNEVLSLGSSVVVSTVTGATTKVITK